MEELSSSPSSQDTASSHDAASSHSSVTESLTKEKLPNADTVIAELDKSHSEIMARIQRLKQEMQSWKSKMDTQVKSCKDELVGLKSTISNDLEQLRSEFQEIRVNLQQQQEDMTQSLKTMEIFSRDLDERGSPKDGHQSADDDQGAQKPDGGEPVS